MRWLLYPLVLCALAPQFGSLDGPQRPVKQYVSFAAEPQVVPAGRPGTLVLRFHVNDGFHVNSHTPKSELLIPTRVELDPSPQVSVASPAYPAGSTFSFPIDPTEKLDVYQGDFLVRVAVTASAGPHELKGALQYQACDHAACFPPRALPLDILFTAR
jgi:DsbC/DsbD-like thiol-disulfide interchange protein